MILRAYDFEHRRDCFMEGELVGSRDDGCLELRMTRWVSAGEEREVEEGQLFWTPPAGALIFDWEDRIETVEPEEIREVA